MSEEDDYHGSSEKPQLDQIQQPPEKIQSPSLVQTQQDRIGPSHWGDFDFKNKKFPKCPSNVTKPELDEFLGKIYHVGVADIVLQSDSRAFIKKGNAYYKVTDRPFRAKEIDDLIASMHRESTPGQVKAGKPAMYHYVVPIEKPDAHGFNKIEYARFRVNCTACMGLHGASDGIDMTMRSVSAYPPTMDELELPKGIQDMAFPSSGLFIITGETDSGKSTTLGSIIRHWAVRPNAVRIITYEDPVEHDFRAIPNTTACISQTSVGVGEMMQDWGACIPNAVRRNPDIIMLGEISTPESMKNAISAARAGHVVYTTLHAGSVALAFSRIINEFPENEQSMAREALITTVRGVVHQSLLTMKDGMKRIAVYEWLELDSYERKKLTDAGVNGLYQALESLVKTRGQTQLTDLESKKEIIDPDSYLSTYRSLTDRNKTDENNGHG
jgi:defect-in-organelle-trafficking protein DotB